MNSRLAKKTPVVPYAIFLLLFVILPILIIIYYAFTDSNGYFTLDAITNFFTDITKLNILFFSVIIGLLTTMICLVIAFPLSYILANPKLNRNYVLVVLFVVPMWINFVLRTGAMKEILSWIGINGGIQPILATLIGMVYNYLPFTILPMYSTMLKLDRSQIEASRDLGCNPIQTFTKNIIPQSLPGIAAAAQMCFMPTMSSYVISDTLSDGRLMLFGNSIYLSFSQSDWNSGSFMSLIMLLIVFISMAVTHRFSRSDEERGGASW